MKDKELVDRLRAREGRENAWNPLYSDKDAMELVDKYKLHLTWNSTHQGIEWMAWHPKRMEGKDVNRRRAICKAVLNGY